MAFLLDLVEQYLAPVDMILHAGDLVAPALLHVFGECPVHGVRGNMDPVSPGVPVKKVLRVGGFNIGLIHGWGPPEGIEARVLAEFPDTPLDCLVYGHTHRPVCVRRNGILFLNPGSATDRRGADFHSVGLLNVGATLDGSILRLD